MAESFAHKFGQTIGDMLQAAMEPVLADFAGSHRLYLDKKGRRPARKELKVTWTDRLGNRHDLDFVLERGGTPDKIGIPVAFIEAAWRRYTKHSRNKAQEIQGAIAPLCETYRQYRPFAGTILGGEFTEGSLRQLRSHGFVVAYFPYKTIVEAFGSVGIKASSDESTSEKEFSRKVAHWTKLPGSKRSKVGAKLRKLNNREIAEFVEALRRVVTRTVQCVRVLPLHGEMVESTTNQDAINFIIDICINNAIQFPSGGNTYAPTEGKCRSARGPSPTRSGLVGHGPVAERSGASHPVRSQFRPELAAGTAPRGTRRFAGGLLAGTPA